MPYTVTNLITKAYYLSRVVAREFETVSGTQMNDGLNLLNDSLADKTISDGAIPYYTNTTFNAISGTSQYFIANLIDLETFVFFIDSVRFSTINPGFRFFHGSARATNITSLPYQWDLVRELGGARLFLYFIPDQNYPLEIWGTYRLASVALNQDLELTLDRFYINFLKYDLAIRICEENNYSVPAAVHNRYLIYLKDIAKRVAPIDTNIRKVSSLSGEAAINYGQVNLGGGWTV